MFRTKYPLSWTFHRNTCRNELNMLSPEKVDSNPEAYKEYLNTMSIRLPEPRLPDMGLGEAVLARYSCRRFQDMPIARQDLANLLFAGYGLTGVDYQGEFEMLMRTIPSGGGLYPLEFYLLVRKVEGLEPGVYHYVIRPALLELLRPVVLPKTLVQELFMHQPYVAEAAVVVVATACIKRTMKKYEDRGYRYILLEAGHAFQNMNLVAAAAGLGAFNLGGFFDEDLARLLGVDMEEEIPLYGMAVGVPDGEKGMARVPR